LFHDAEVGLDIEDLSVRGGFTRARRKGLAERFFSGDETRYLLGNERSEDTDDALRFFRIWTAKESYVKYTGGGMSEGLRSFSFLDPPGGVTITTFELAPGLVCSYCLPGRIEPEIMFWNGDVGQRGTAWKVSGS
jgi:phosphopantetheinyl transferase (holo-ACP synthase)